MRYQKYQIQFPFIIFLIILFIQTFQIVSVYISLSQLERNYVERYPVPWSLIFTPQTNILLVCTAIMMLTVILYYVFRNRYMNILYSRIFIWLSFVSLIAVPFFRPFFKMETPNGAVSDAVRIGNVIFYPFSSILSLFLFIAAIIFFILAIIKSSTSPKESVQPNESTGFLDEFTQ